MSSGNKKEHRLPLPGQGYSLVVLALANAAAAGYRCNGEAFSETKKSNK